MGRKPNPLILEFFERGPKLPDASNRYQHTCRACGEVFPKGRIDSLTTHLVKRCPAIPLRDRHRALHQLHDLPDLEPTNGTREDPKGRPGPGPRRGQGRGSAQANANNAQAAADTEHGWTALKTLAEVSRQFDLSEKRTPTPTPTPTPHGISGERHLAGEDPDPDGHGDPSTAGGPQYEDWLSEEPRELDSSHPTTALPPIQFYGPPPPPHAFGANGSGLSLTSSADLTVAPDLLPTAAAAMAHATQELHPGGPAPPGVPLEPDLVGVPHHAGISDQFFNRRGLSIRPASTWPLGQSPLPLDPALLDATPDRDPKGAALPSRTGTLTRPLAIHPHVPPRAYTTEFSASPKHARQKVRGRFTASRRKEVQQVRKLGACIRCRMLKKPCSGESPCATCRGVESARLWKQPCIRTRFVDELELYSAGVYSVLAAEEVRQIKDHVSLQRFPGQIEATHYRDSPIYAIFNALEGRRPPTSRLIPAIDPALTGADVLPELLLLDSDGDDLPGKLETYTTKMTSTFVDREPSPFMQPTLRFALELTDQKKDTLLQRVLELWAINHVLVDLEMKWITFGISGPEGAGYRRQAIDDEAGGSTYERLCVQLRAAAEKRAAQIARTLLNELERRLLQRTQSGWFETFLAAICLLNCVERSSWMFSKWEYDKSVWPLDRKPLYFYHQSERFAEMLHMLLKMRGLPPKTQQSPGGILTAVTDDPTTQRFFEAIRISSTTLEERQEAHFDPHNSRSLELKFCAKLLLPS